MRWRRPSQARIRVRIARAADELRCPYCHDGLGTETERSVQCGHCHAPAHAECWSELGSCACCRARYRLGEVIPVVVRARGSRLVRWWRDSEIGILVAAGLLVAAPVLSAVALGVLESSARRHPLAFLPGAVDWGGDTTPMSPIWQHNIGDDRPARARPQSAPRPPESAASPPVTRGPDATCGE